MPKLTSNQPNGLFYVLFLSILRLFDSVFIFLIIESSIVGIFYGRDIFWYFIHANSLKSYDFMCNYNSESKRVPEKKAIFFELILLLAVS